MPVFGALLMVDPAFSFNDMTGRALSPLQAHDRPHQPFLQWHRADCFKK